MRWLVRGDIDGFFGLALDNLVQLLLIDTFCRFVLGFPPELIYGRVLPGAAVSILVGNVFYAVQAKRLADRTGRTDVCALPYGINTVSLISHVFLVMLPAKVLATQAGAADPARVAWQAGLLATLCSGLIEVAAAFVAERVRKVTPRAALLSTLAGIALGFISLGFLFRTFARPIVGLTTLGIVMLTYFGRVRFKGRIPGGMVAVALGTLLAWAIGIAPVGDRPSAAALHLPVPIFGDLAAAITRRASAALPVGDHRDGSLQRPRLAPEHRVGRGSRRRLPNAAVAAGERPREHRRGALRIDISHDDLHRASGLEGARRAGRLLGAERRLHHRSSASTGTLAWIAWAIPIDAGMAIVLWIGIVISAQAFQTTPREHAPAVVVGLLPGIGAWGALMAKNGLHAAGLGGAGRPFSEALIGEFQKSDTWIHGAFSLEQGFLFTSMLLAAAVVGVIERKWTTAAAWCAVAALLSASGLMHSYQWTPDDTVLKLAPAWPFVIGYGVMSALFFSARWTTEPEDGSAPLRPPSDRARN